MSCAARSRWPSRRTWWSSCWALTRPLLPHPPLPPRRPRPLRSPLPSLTLWAAPPRRPPLRSPPHPPGRGPRPPSQREHPVRPAPSRWRTQNRLRPSSPPSARLSPPRPLPLPGLPQLRPPPPRAPSPLRPSTWTSLRCHPPRRCTPRPSLPRSLPPKRKRSFYIPLPPTPSSPAPLRPRLPPALPLRAPPSLRPSAGRRQGLRQRAGRAARVGRGEAAQLQVPDRGALRAADLTLPLQSIHTNRSIATVWDTVSAVLRAAPPPPHCLRLSADDTAAASASACRFEQYHDVLHPRLLGRLVRRGPAAAPPCPVCRSSRPGR